MTDERFDELVKRAMKLACDVTNTPAHPEHYGQIFCDILRHLIDNESKAKARGHRELGDVTARRPEPSSPVFGDTVELADGDGECIGVIYDPKDADLIVEALNR